MTFEEWDEELEQELLEELAEEEEEQEEDDRGDEVDDDDDDDEDESDEESEDDEEESDDEESDEDEESDDDDDDEESEDDDESDDKDDPRSKMIPRHRFDQVYNDMKKFRDADRAKAERIAELERQKPSAPQDEGVNDQIKETRKAMLKAINDGKDEEAEQLFEKLDELQEQKINQRLAEGSKTSTKQAAEEVEYNLLVERIEGDFPVFDENSNYYDQELVDLVMGIQSQFEQAGDKPSLALEKAMHFYREETDEAMQAAGLLDPDESKEKPSKSLKKRSITQKKKNKDAKGQQPPKTRGSESSSKSDMSIDDLVRMSDSEFDKLTPEEIRRMRGDTAV